MDLVAHVMINYHRGISLYGKKIRTIFEDVGREIYHVLDEDWKCLELNINL